MASFLLTGEYYTAPDRGSPDGHWYPIKHSFHAKSHNAACGEVKRYLEDKYSYSSRGKEEFRGIKLVSTREIDLTNILE